MQNSEHICMNMYIHGMNMYVHSMYMVHTRPVQSHTCCPNRFSWPTQRWSTEWSPSSTTGNKMSHSIHSIMHKVCEIVLWGNSDNTSCQAPELRTNMYVHVWTMYVHGMNHVHPRLYLFLIFMWVFQHAHIINIKTVANLSNNKDLFMCWIPAALRDLAQGT